MVTWYLIFFVLALILAGFVRQRAKVQQDAATLVLAQEFLTKFIEWCNGHAENAAHYNWMLHHSEEVQAALGSTGTVSMRRPFENGYHANYAIILNAIPEIQTIYRDRHGLGRDNQQALIQLVDACLRRFIGLLDRDSKRQRARMRNPLVLLSSGVAWLLEIPLFFLGEFHVISDARRSSIAKGTWFSLVSAVTTLATFLATLVSIVREWDQLRAMVAAWFGK